MRFKIGYMVDPGDGIVSYDTLDLPDDNLFCAPDDMIGALMHWQDLRCEEGLDPYFIVSAEIIGESD